MNRLLRIAVLCAWARAGFAVEPPIYSPQARSSDLASFELIWTTLRDRYWDKSMAGLNWQSVHDEYAAKVRLAANPEAARQAMVGMVALLPSSHLAIIPRSVYQRKDTPASKQTKPPQSSAGDSDEDSADAGNDDGSAGFTVGVVERKLVVERVETNSGAAKAGVQTGWVLSTVDQFPTEDLFRRFSKPILVESIVARWLNGPVGSLLKLSFVNGEGRTIESDVGLGQPAGNLTRFGNLPPERVEIEHRKLDTGAGYIRLNFFLDPVHVMPEIAKAVQEFRGAPGIVLDLRGNPGGIAAMAMGVAGWFVDEEGKRLGTMTSREMTLNFVVNPRLEPYTGRVAILVNEGSASTAEILAQGLRDLNRARIFGTRTAGAALPSNIIRLPNGDRFQYPEANYRAVNGRVLESNGVEPDVMVEPTIPALLAGHDLPLEAASEWCVKGK